MSNRLYTQYKFETCKYSIPEADRCSRSRNPYCFSCSRCNKYENDGSFESYDEYENYVGWSNYYNNEWGNY